MTSIWSIRNDSKANTDDNHIEQDKENKTGKQEIGRNVLLMKVITYPNDRHSSFLCRLYAIKQQEMFQN
jgi:hypothetical protein